METVTTPIRPRLARRRVALGVVLLAEAFVSPIVWWGTYIFGALFSTDERASGGRLWLDVMGRLGNWGVLILVALLVGAAVVLFTRPPRFPLLVAGLCIATGLLNAVVALGLLWYNGVVDDGPLGPRFVGVASAAAFGLIGVGLFVTAFERPFGTTGGHAGF